jgi:hypothetical protein
VLVALLVMTDFYLFAFVAFLGTIVVHLNFVLASSVVSVIICKNLCRHKHSAYNHCDNHQLFHNTCFLKLLIWKLFSFFVCCKFMTRIIPLQGVFPNLAGGFP